MDNKMSRRKYDNKYLYRQLLTVHKYNFINFTKIEVNFHPSYKNTCGQDL